MPNNLPPTQPNEQTPKIQFGIQRRFAPYESRATFTKADGDPIPLPYFPGDERWRIARDPEPRVSNILEAIQQELRT